MPRGRQGARALPATSGPPQTADDAFVNDAHREFWGTDAIRRWIAKVIRNTPAY